MVIYCSKAVQTALKLTKSDMVKPENLQETDFYSWHGHIAKVDGRNVIVLMNDKTMTFSIGDQTEQEIRRILVTVYDSLKEKGYNPINQIVGYILSEDPTYITTHNNARSVIRRIDRDELMQKLVETYLEN